MPTALREEKSTNGRLLWNVPFSLTHACVLHAFNMRRVRTCTSSSSGTSAITVFDALKAFFLVYQLGNAGAER
jgi:hypothetical protein